MNAASAAPAACSSLARDSPASACLPEATTVAPCLANAAAVALPMPVSACYEYYGTGHDVTSPSPVIVDWELDPIKIYLTLGRVARASAGRRGVACEASEGSRRCDGQRCGMTTGRGRSLRGGGQVHAHLARASIGRAGAAPTANGSLCASPAARIRSVGRDALAPCALPRSRMRHRAPVPSPGSVPAPGNLSRPVSPGRPPPARVLMCLPGRTVPGRRPGTLHASASPVGYSYQSHWRGRGPSASYGRP